MSELPNSPESEKVINGSILVEPSLLPAIKLQVSPDRFYTPSQRKIYTALLSLHEQDIPVDSASLINELRSTGVSVLAIQDCMEIMHGIPATLPTQHISQVIRLARKRWIMQFAERLEARAAESDETEDELLEFAAAQIDGARTKLPHQAKIRFLDDMMDDQAGRYRAWHRGISNAIPTGFGMLDEKLQGGGLVPSGLYIIGARPSMGKSALALDIAANVAQEGKTVHIVSREMPAESLLDRLHAANAGIPRWMLRAGIYQKEYNKLIQTLPQVCKLPIALDNLSLTVSDIRANFRDMERKHRRPSLLIVDYVQLVNANGRSRNDEVGAVTRGLKAMAMEFDIPVIALSQLSRECDKQKREPEMSDLRDSGEVEQDADAIFLLFGEKPEEGAKIYGRNFKCAKQRDGELFTREILFNAELVTFRSFEQLSAAGVQQMGDVA